MGVHKERRVKRGDKMKLALKIINILSSNSFLMWTGWGWILYYVISSIWMKEAFANFVDSLKTNPLTQIPFVIFLVSGYLNIIRASRIRIQKGISQFILWIFLPAGILLFFTGFFLSASTRQVEQIIAGEGDVIRPRWDRDSYNIINVNPGLKERFLDIETGAGLFAHEPEISIQDESQKIYKIKAFPPVKIKGSYYHILNFGLAPGIRLSENSSLKDEGYMPLRILGGSDFFEIPGHPYRFLISMKPERVIQKGRLIASEYNLKNPVYTVRVFKGESLIIEGDSDKGIRFDNLMLQFFEPVFWVQLEMVKDYGVTFIISGIVFILAGIPPALIRLLLRTKNSL